MKQSEFVKKAKKLIERNKDKEYARTGCTLLDCVVGGGEGLGFPFSRIINIMGDKSAGKTFVANEIIGRNYHDYGKRLIWNYDDSEDGYTFDTKKLYGVDIINDGKDYSSDKVEDLDGNYTNFLKSIKGDKLPIYVVDSLDGLSNIEVEERSEDRAKAVKAGKDYNEGTYNMGTASFLSKEFFRTKASQTYDKKSLFIILSQIRDNVNAFPYQRNWVRSGGKALDFYAHTALVLSNMKKLKRKVKLSDGTEIERIYGVVVKALADKSKTPRPYRECIFTIYFDYGIDNIGSNLDFLFNLRGKDGLLTKAQNEIQWNGKPKTLNNLKEFLESNNWLDQARKEKKEETNNKRLDDEWIVEWLEKESERKKKSKEYFGESYTRDELIEMCEKDKKLEEELEVRVIAKWEEIEYHIGNKRKGKYV